MSALFQSTQATVVRTVEMERALEPRTVPLLYDLQESARDYAGSSTAASNLIADLYQNLATNWVYGATLELSMNSSRPAWTQGHWSFVPVDLSRAVDGKPGNAALANAQAPAVNVSVLTAAIRGRVECTQYRGLDNNSLWLTQWDLNNQTIWNSSTTPEGTSTAYEPGEDSTYFAPGTLVNTTILSDDFVITCCANESSHNATGSAIGYWSPEHSKYDGFPFVETPWPMNITTKWIHGPAVSGVSQLEESNSRPRSDLLMFTDIPSIQALHCAPIVETATARVMVDAHSGQVYSYEINGDIVNATEAWSDVFVQHAPAALHGEGSDHVGDKAVVNYTVR